MRSPGTSSFLLLLILGLSPRPGDFQGAAQFKECPECKKILPEKEVKPAFFQILVKKATYTECPRNIIKFELPKGVFCGQKTESWAENVMKCIKQGRDSCLQQSESEKDFSKGSNEKPPITTLETTTSTARSTQTWKGGTSKPSEDIYTTTRKILETTIGLSITVPNSEQKNDLLHDVEPTTDPPNEKSKMKQMTIAIVSLILIVLVMTSVGVYVWCRKVRFSKCRSFSEENPVKYKPAPSEDNMESGP